MSTYKRIEGCGLINTLESATAVETQLSEMNAIKERARNEKQKWLTTISKAYKEIMVRESFIYFPLPAEWSCLLKENSVGPHESNQKEMCRF